VSPPSGERATPLSLLKDEFRSANSTPNSKGRDDSITRSLTSFKDIWVLVVQCETRAVVVEGNRGTIRADPAEPRENISNDYLYNFL
jgi:hypothetical protein